MFCVQAFLRNYTWVGVGRVGSTVNAITQTFELATNDKRHKLELLIQALTKAPPPQLTLVFVQKKRTASWVAGQVSLFLFPYYEGIFIYTRAIRMTMYFVYS